MIGRLGRKDGFTLSEMLMTTLIICLVVLLLGGGVYVIKNAYDKVTAKAEAQTILSTAVTLVVDEFRYATNINKRSDDGTPCNFWSGNRNCQIWFKNAYGGEEDEGKIGIVVCDGANKRQLLTTKTMAEGLTPEINNYNYVDGVFTATISIKRDKKDFVEQKITIRPVNN